MHNKVWSKVRFETRKFGHVRFKEPILVFESDDWGKVNGVESGFYPPELGTRTDWSYDRLESEEDLEDLYRLLESFRDDFERIPAFTANFIVSNPDIEATKSNYYQSLILQPIDVAYPDLYKKWLEGVIRGVFYPQYHGRLHYNAVKYTHALQTDADTRALFNQGINGGRENFEPTQYALYSEYFDTEKSTRLPDLTDWVKHGLKDFERIFGYRSESTIAPNYVVHPEQFSLFHQLGIKYLQGGNKILFTEEGKEQRLNYCQGYKSPSGLIMLARNHKFEPCRGKKEWQSAFSIEAANYWFKRGVPAVIDTHRMNYAGQFAEESRLQLVQFLNAMKEIKGLKILTSSELGEAITTGGVYRDVFSGEMKTITPLDNGFRKLARRFVN